MIETIARTSIVALYSSGLVSSALLFIVIDRLTDYEDEDKILKTCKGALKISLVIFILSSLTLLVAIIAYTTTK